MDNSSVSPSDPQSALHSDAVPPSQPNAPLVEVNSVQLFQGAREILIRHKDELYRLRLTKNDRLILHK